MKVILCLFILSSCASSLIRDYEILNYDYTRSPNSTVMVNEDCSAIIRNFFQNELLSQDIKKIASGIEIEAHIHKDIGKENLAIRLEEILKEKYNDVSVEKKHFFVSQEEGESALYPRFSGAEAEKEDLEAGIDIPVTDYTFRYLLDGEEKVWEIKHDVTIGFHDDLIPVEITTPKMINQKEVKDAFIIFKKMKKFGLREAKETGGVHFHFDWPNPTVKEKVLAILVFSALEVDLAKLFSVSPHRKFWIGLNIGSTGKTEVLRKRIKSHLTGENSRSIEDVLSAMFKKGSSVHLPFTFSKHGTIEFRFLNSTLDTQTLSVVRSLFLKITLQIKNDPNSLIKLVKKYPNTNIPLKELFGLIKFDFQKNEEIFTKIFKDSMEI